MKLLLSHVISEGFPPIMENQIKKKTTENKMETGYFTYVPSCFANSHGAIIQLSTQLPSTHFQGVGFRV